MKTCRKESNIKFYEPYRSKEATAIDINQCYLRIILTALHNKFSKQYLDNDNGFSSL
jgi:hypothetical protein